jgi:hypothetical protein
MRREKENKKNNLGLYHGGLYHFWKKKIKQIIIIIISSIRILLLSDDGLVYHGGWHIVKTLYFPSCNFVLFFLNFETEWNLTLCNLITPNNYWNLNTRDTHRIIEVLHNYRNLKKIYLAPKFKSFIWGIFPRMTIYRRTTPFFFGLLVLL